MVVAGQRAVALQEIEQVGYLLEVEYVRIISLGGHVELQVHEVLDLVAERCRWQRFAQRRAPCHVAATAGPMPTTSASKAPVLAIPKRFMPVFTRVDGLPGYSRAITGRMVTAMCQAGTTCPDAAAQERRLLLK